jgi:tetratricopeptide (TPR) repeat protein
LTINPNKTYALDNKGYDLNALGNHSGAILYYDKALALDPHDVDALNNKGLALGLLGNHTGAIEYFDKVLDIDPHDVSALTGKGVSLNGVRNYSDAIEYFDKALAVEQGYVKGTQQYWFNRGVAEGNNELPKSSTNAYYTQGYNDATWGIQHKRDSPSIVKIPVQTTDNYRDFYLGMYEGGAQYNEEGSCPPGYTVEYCAGYKLGYEWSSNVMSFSG